MDIQLALLSSLVKEGLPAYRTMQRHNIDASQFSGEAKDVFDFISEYYLEYKDLPSPEVIEAKLDISLIPLRESFEFFLNEFKAARLHNFWQEYLNKLLTSQDKKKPYKTQELIEEALTKVKELNLAPSAIEEMGALGIEAFNLYEALERDETGILTPWPSINAISRGFWPQDLVIFAARSGQGKTINMLLLAQHAFDVQEKRVLFISPEMPKERLALRFNAIKYKLPYGKILEGNLADWEKRKFWAGVESTKKNQGFGVVASKNFDYSISSLAAAISYYKPDIVYIDGVYLLKSNGANRNDQAANLMNDIKRLAIRFGIPIVISTQFNRTVEKDKSSTVKDTGIAMTDVANWNNSFAAGLSRDKDMINNNLLEMTILKVRDGKNPGSVMLNWNFDTMDFSEVIKDAAQNAVIKSDPHDPYAVPKETPVAPATREIPVDESYDESPF